MPQLLGRRRLVALAIFLSSCRTDQPPKIEVCIVAPGGSADCVLADGTQVTRLPSEMVNYWATSQVDMQNFSSWCYGIAPETARLEMQRVRAQTVK